ncbi:hypothetical protein D3C87_1694650 [compost metagenome]
MGFDLQVCAFFYSRFPGGKKSHGFVRRSATPLGTMRARMCTTFLKCLVVTAGRRLARGRFKVHQASTVRFTVGIDASPVRRCQQAFANLLCGKLGIAAVQGCQGTADQRGSR